MRQLFAKSIGQTCEPAKLHPYGEVLAFYIRRVDVVGIRIAAANFARLFLHERPDFIDLQVIDEKSSADKVMRTPLSKQRNKHIQRVLVEAAKLAPRQNHDLALVYEREKQKGNANRATLAVARKMVAYLLAVDRGQRDFVPFADPRSVAA